MKLGRSEQTDHKVGDVQKVADRMSTPMPLRLEALNWVAGRDPHECKVSSPSYQWCRQQRVVQVLAIRVDGPVGGTSFPRRNTLPLRFNPPEPIHPVGRSFHEQMPPNREQAEDADRPRQREQSRPRQSQIK